MSGWTKGPWEMDSIRSGDKDIFIRAAGDGWERLEATVRRDDCDRNVAEANARLIVAAPEMYEALEEIANHLYQPNLDMSRCRDMAKAALAKASGTK